MEYYLALIWRLENSCLAYHIADSVLGSTETLHIYVLFLLSAHPLCHPCTKLILPCRHLSNVKNLSHLSTRVSSLVLEPMETRSFSQVHASCNNMIDAAKWKHWCFGDPEEWAPSALVDVWERLNYGEGRGFIIAITKLMTLILLTEILGTGSNECKAVPSMSQECISSGCTEKSLVVLFIYAVIESSAWVFGNHE